MWACGVVLYTLLVGFPPFWHRKQLMMIRQIMEGKFSFSSSDWSNISTQAKDLISAMLGVVGCAEDRELHSAFVSLSDGNWLKNLRTFNLGRCVALAVETDGYIAVVEPAGRVTVAQSLQHEFFQPSLSRRSSLVETQHQFRPGRAWRVAGLAVRAVVRITRLRTTPEPVSLQAAATSPYKVLSHSPWVVTSTHSDICIRGMFH